MLTRGPLYDFFGPLYPVAITQRKLKVMLYFKAVVCGLYGVGVKNYMKRPPGGQVCQL